MTVFGIEADNNKAIYQFIEDTNNRLQVSDFLKNPYTGKMVLIEQEEKLRAGVVMKPIYPNPFYFGLVSIIATAIIGGLTLWLIAPLLFTMSGFLHTDRFNFIFLKKGLKKAGYSGKIKMLSAQEVAEVYINGTGRSI